MIGAVTRLAEPYRSTVLLRFFEGFSVEELSRRQGIPGSTGRTRLQRALEMLRERLDHEYGGERSAWSALLVPLAAQAPEISGGTAWTATALEGLQMGVKLKVAAGAIVLAGAALVVWNPLEQGDVRGSAPPGDRGSPVALAGAASPDGPAMTETAATPGLHRAREPVPVPDRAAPTTDVGVLVYGSVLGRDGERVSDGWITFVDELGATSHASFGAPGSYSMLGLGTGTHRVIARCPGFLESDGVLEIGPGAERAQHDIVLVPSPAIPVRFLDEAGEPFELDRAGLGIGGIRPVVVATEAPPPPRLPGIEGRDASWFGVGEYRDRSPFEPLAEVGPRHQGILRLWRPLPLHVSAVLQDTVLETRRLDGVVDELVFTLSKEKVGALLGGLRLQVVDAVTGAPIAGGWVALSTSDTGGGGKEIGSEGRVELQGHSPGIHEFDFRVPGYETLKKRVRIEPGRVVDLGAVGLFRRATIEGTILDAAGNPISTRLAWFSIPQIGMPQDVETRLHARSDGSGSFSIQAGRTRTAIVAGGNGWALGLVRVDATPGEVRGVEIRLERGTLVHFHPPDRSTQGLRFTLATGDGLPFRSRTIQGMLPSSERLPPGRYQLWLSRDEELVERSSLEVGLEPMKVVLPTAGGRR